MMEMASDQFIFTECILALAGETAACGAAAVELGASEYKNVLHLPQCY